MNDLIRTLEKFKDEARLYADLVYEVERPIRVGLELTDTGDTATLHLEKDQGVKTIEEGLEDIHFKVTMSSEVFHQISNGEADAFALAGRSHIQEVRPINFQFVDPTRAKDAMEAIKGLGTYYFVPGSVKTKPLTIERAGQAHGARPIPLVYWQGLRTAWYYLEAGSILNEAGEKDPWPQAFIVLQGEGTVLIDKEEMTLKTNNIYYIPRNVLHQVKAQSEVVVIWIAWDAE